MSKQHDELETPAAMEKRLGKAAENFARDFYPCDSRDDSLIYNSRKAGFIAGAKWQKEQAKK